MIQTRADLRNVAIVAHVDHGKTTLVDGMLWQGGAFDARATVEKTGERVMDSGDLEREKGITILAKNTAITYHGPSAAEFGAPEGVTINVIDTPGHADFSGEVERGLSMVDGVVLLVDASEGPLPQTRFVLRKALEANMPVITVINKVDRPDARISEVVDEAQDLLLNLASDIDDADLDLDRLLEIPVIYAAAKAGRADTEQPRDGELPANENLEPLFRAILEYIPAPTYEEDAPLVGQVTNLDASPFLGRLALVRVYSGELKKGAWVGLANGPESDIERVHITELLRTQGLERVPATTAGPGDIVAVAGMPNIMIGETLVDLEDPRPMPRIHIDDPAISMTIGINTSPLAGKVKGHKLTARQVRDRLTQELVGNVSIRVLPTDRPDAWEVQDRGELALAILVETMRREGFELTVGKPQVVKRVIDGVIHEPWERATIDVPEEHLGAVTQLMAARKGQMATMSNHGSGWVRMEFVLPSRGMIGFRTQFLTQTRGTGIAASISEGYAPWAGEIESRNTGSLVSDRSGQVTAFSLQRLEDRGTFFVDPGEETYEGQIVGENPRNEDMEVNVVKAKEMTNMRSATADAFETLQARRKLTLEECIEFAADDECIEVTPETVRVRKVILNTTERLREAARRKRAAGK
ncbi:Tyrosine phosphorylated protein A [Arcanobacterium haemolyticum]|uniref:Large ribosomal subunit assembly factor BipA n=1 Tax=Arcanobacterium haemolyticum (strain ATCC 9345 / DSM 20595 / CCM 5947 / CCUG 17215 / LMG 16163 / NBRC 15585 / NCTC 8452 / 11018) TaxID=644284 RepID=D7BKF9_ARCHD|nr:GTP-binding protein TypA [Arcanobacterium haemolyticum DSM 20595]SPT75288.1 Tyrosine phosphorylated protein A [Arcanobacterium haemolyticum]SQH28104.1 Tyrosine phosphorylated protein A [Arcanobacterium haemolyticum]